MILLWRKWHDPAPQDITTFSAFIKEGPLCNTNTIFPEIISFEIWTRLTIFSAAIRYEKTSALGATNFPMEVGSRASVEEDSVDTYTQYK